jgi:hypothetical protein
MLLMKKRFFDAIRSGVKTTTLRFWRHPRVRPGSEHLVPGLGRIRIASVSAIRPEDLRSRDARADGFGDLAGLRAALDLLYPRGQRQGRRLYRVRFEFLGSSMPPGAGASRRPVQAHGESDDSLANNRVK